MGVRQRRWEVHPHSSRHRDCQRDAVLDGFELNISQCLRNIHRGVDLEAFLLMAMSFEHSDGTNLFLIFFLSACGSDRMGGGLVCVSRFQTAVSDVVCFHAFAVSLWAFHMVCDARLPHLVGGTSSGLAWTMVASNGWHPAVWIIF